MPNAKFTLKKPKSKEDTPVYLTYAFNYKRLRYYTGIKVLPKYWDKEKQRVKQSQEYPQYSEYNYSLRNIKNAVDTAYREIVNNGEEPTPDALKEKLLVKLGKKSKERRQSLLDFIDRFIDEKRSTLKPSSLKKYTTLKNKLTDYTNDTSGGIDFPDIDLDFYYDFIDYMNNHKKLYALNYIGTIIRDLKTILNEATERGINTNIAYQSKKFKVLVEDVEKTYLSIKELDQLHKHDFSKSKKLEKVRDLFIIQCYTGLRYSDMIRLNPANIKSTKQGMIINIRMEKTGGKVSIPMLPIVEDILNKYDGKIPDPISNQKMNEYLKDIAKEVKLNREVELSKTLSGKPVTTKKKLHEIIHSHMGRRSFATNAHFEWGWSSHEIRMITGHNTESSFLRYINVTPEENAMKLLDHPATRRKLNVVK